MSLEDEAARHAAPTEAERDAIRRAQQAQQLVTDPMMVDAFANLEDNWMHVMRYGSDTKTRENAHHLLKVLDLCRAELQHHLETGKFATSKIGERELQAAYSLTD